MLRITTKYFLLFRLTGVYAFVCLFHMTLLRVFQGGPLESVPELVKICRGSWWRNFLYITNFELTYVDEAAEAVSVFCILIGQFFTYFSCLSFPSFNRLLSSNHLYFFNRILFLPVLWK